MANLAEAVGADVHVIAKAMGMDGRISPKFLHPGPGYGGSCFPKDTKAAASIGERFGVDMSLLKETVRANENQKLKMIEKLKRLVDSLEERSVTVLGLAFKAETDDVRESPAIKIIEMLLAEGARVNVHDPKAMNNFRKIFPNEVRYFNDEFEAAEGADAVLICTEWNEYRNIDLEKLKSMMRGKVLLDTRNIIDMERAKKIGFRYEGVGRR